MTSGSTDGADQAAADPSGRAEPITLTDPDGAVTRVAPWSTWTREQVRAPGGEPSLVTKLTDGQLWYAAGRRRSPWRHEVHAGPAVVTTPRGRFQVTAEADGGATIACLAGRTRVVAGSREPVVLGPDQTATVSSDGGTLMVMDRASSESDPAAGPAPGATPAAAPAATAAATDPTAAAPEVPATDGADEPDVSPPPVAAPPGRLRRRIAEVVAVAALLAALVAAVVVFGDAGGGSDDLAAGPGNSGGPSSVDRDRSTTTEATTTSEPVTTTTAATTTTVEVTTTTESTTTTEPAVTTPPAVATTPPATADGFLAACRRADGSVVATVDVAHRSGGPGRFTVGVAVVDAAGRIVADGRADSDELGPGASAPVEVAIDLGDGARGACELLSVTPA